ncbi:MAG: OmpA family protein, partial [Myxococcales bacterium]|nr:OmpA family protein [Myxococcales bacterium]
VSVISGVDGGGGIAADSVDGEELPIEALLGLRFRAARGLTITTGGGAGVSGGLGTPDYRIFLGVGYGPTDAADSDGDGLNDDEDGCPDVPEDFDSFEDDDGCPEADNDGDGIVDSEDQCPLQPEDPDTWEDQDGCPDPDNDSDGIADSVDTCPLDSEDPDGWQDQDGCPDPDNDGDGFLDADDGCPLEAETVNSYQDDDGCPDAIAETPECYAFDHRVHFDNDSSTLDAQARTTLSEVAELMNQHPEIEMVVLEGHTDARADREHNETLSNERARAVRDFLTSQGVDASRFRLEAFASSRPVSSNDSEQGRAQNRRVEIRIERQAPGCD